MTLDYFGIEQIYAIKKKNDAKRKLIALVTSFPCENYVNKQ